MHLPSNARAVVVHRRVLAVIFVLAGAAKLVGAAPIVEVFTRFGLPLWFMRGIGTAEVAGAIGMLVPPLVPFAAAGLAAILTGAIAEHVCTTRSATPCRRSCSSPLRSTWHTRRGSGRQSETERPLGGNSVNPRGQKRG
jgi:hypothetical protein